MSHKRIHAKRKPPRFKRIVFDGTTTRTKFVRMAPILAACEIDEMKTEMFLKTTNENSANKTETMFEIFSSDSNKLSDERTTYTERRRKVIEAWDNLRSKLVETRLEELSPSTYNCSFCDSLQTEVIFCRDCGPAAYYCLSCCTRIHKNILFHRPQQWKGCLYVPIIMKNELSRKDHCCDSMFTSEIYIVDMKGTQHISKVSLCRCEEAALTLLRYNLWPATVTSPKIAFDLRFMELLSVLQLECHLPAKTFCDALGHLQANFVDLTVDAERNIYRAVVGDCLTEYNHHRSTFNTGSTITSATFGMECPVCLNNPSIVSMDANFGLVHKSSSGEGHGRESARHKNGFFLNHENLTTFVSSYGDESKNAKNDCSNFQAGSIIRSKVKNQKLDVTGVFGSVCKHDIPLHFVDLMHGERLSYPVYILEQLLKDRTDQMIVMYDIACMLHKHLQKKKNDGILQKCKFVVPAFHSFAHNMDCQLNYGQRFSPVTGLTDGEGIERLWSYLRGFSKITKEMSLNNRQDLLTEALLHHTEKQIWNIANRLESKRIKCEKIITETTKVIQDAMETVSTIDETEDKIKAWQMEWKEQTSKALKKAVILSLDEQYAECLKKVESKKIDINAAETEVDKLEHEKELERLLKDSKKLKKKSSFSHIHVDVDTDTFQRLLVSAKEKRRLSSLRQLKELATDRQYLSSSMKKYAVGQGIGLRISRQFAVNFSKMKKEVETYSSIVEESKEVSAFLSPNSEIFDELSGRKITAQHQKAVESYSLRECAREEHSKICYEMSTFMTSLTNQSLQILKEIEELKNDHLNRLILGKIHLLHTKHFVLETLSESFVKKCNSASFINASVPRRVNEILASEVLSIQVIPVEEIESIVQEILTFEKHNEEEEEEEDDVDDADNDE